MPLIPALGKQVDFCESEASIVYRERSSMRARAIWKSHLKKGKRKENQNNSNKKKNIIFYQA